MGDATFEGRARNQHDSARHGCAARQRGVSTERTHRRKRRIRWHALTSAALVVLTSLGAHASGIDPTKISVPKGPGSIEGLASADFSPSLSSGAASYDIPIAVPPASAGFGPSIALAYDSSGGATEIGIGWRIAGIPKIRRRTE